MKGLVSYLRGYVRLEVKKETQSFSDFWNVLCDLDILFWDLHQTEERLTCCVFAKDAHRLATLAPRLSVTVLEETGLPRLLFRYRRRFGLLLGGLLCAGILWLSGQFAWRIEVSGNELLTQTEIEAGLEPLGCKVGAYLPSIDFFDLSKAYLLQEERLAWVSVQRDGNVISVRVKEKQTPKEEEKHPLSNLIASADGIIISTALGAGQSVVKPGDTVRKGELLVSGLCENKTGTYTLSGAQGKVFAKIEKEISVEIPFVQTVAVQSQEKKTEKMIKIFGKTIKFSKKSGNFDAKYGTIRRERDVILFHRILLPIRVLETEYFLTEEKCVTLGEEEILSMAQLQMETLLTDLAKSATVLSQTPVTKTVSDTTLTLTVTVTCITDIAVAQQIYLQDQMRN